MGATSIHARRQMDLVADYLKGKLTAKQAELLLADENLERVRTALLALDARTAVHLVNAKKRIAEAQAAEDPEEVAAQYYALAGTKSFRGRIHACLREINGRLREQRRAEEVVLLRQLVDWLVSLDNTVAELEDDCPEPLAPLLSASLTRLSAAARKESA